MPTQFLWIFFMIGPKYVDSFNKEALGTGTLHDVMWVSQEHV